MTVMAKKGTRVRALRDESEDSVVLDLAALINQDPPNVDAIMRKTGKYNRLRGRRVKLAILSALRQKGEKDVNVLLDRHG